MKTISPLKSKIYLVVFNLFCFVAMAQDDGDPGFPGEDPGDPLPINDWIVPMFIIGIILLFYYYKKYQKTEVINPQQKV